MKRIVFYLTAMFLSFTFIPVSVNADAAGTSQATEVDHAAGKSKAKILLARLEAIKEMDKSNLSSDEKKGLRKEVRTIRSELRKTEGGVYLSVGAIIIIVLLLILLL